jgi:hypothetical protein
MAIYEAAEALIVNAAKRRDEAKEKEEVKEKGKGKAQEDGEKGSEDATPRDETSAADSTRDEYTEFEDVLRMALAAADMPQRAEFTAIRFIAKVRAEKPRHALMLESLLLSAVAQFEVFVSRIIKTSLLTDPKPLTDSDRKFLFKDIIAEGSFEGFLASVANDYVDGLMYDGMDQWMKFLQRATRSDTEWVTDLLAEVVMRRNVHVHAGGRASQQYINKLGKSAAAVKLGDELPVTSAYLEDALDRMARAAIVLSQAGIAAVCAGAKKDKKKKHAISQDAGVVDASFDLLVAGRYRATKELWPQLDKLVSLNSTRERLRANSFAARKLLNGLPEVVEDITEWDVSAAEDEIVLAKLCLLDDVEAASELYTKLEARGDMTVMELATWPILEPLRRAIEGGNSPDVEGEAPQGD